MEKVSQALLIFGTAFGWAKILDKIQKSAMQCRFIENVPRRVRILSHGLLINLNFPIVIMFILMVVEFNG